MGGKLGDRKIECYSTEIHTYRYDCPSLSTCTLLIRTNSQTCQNE